MDGEIRGCGWTVCAGLPYGIIDVTQVIDARLLGGHGTGPEPRHCETDNSQRQGANRK